MLAFAPDYENLTLIAKVEVFEHALQNTDGNDIAKVSVCYNYSVIGRVNMLMYIHLVFRFFG